MLHSATSEHLDGIHSRCQHLRLPPVPDAHTEHSREQHSMPQLIGKQLQLLAVAGCVGLSQPDGNLANFIVCHMMPQNTRADLPGLCVNCYRPYPAQLCARFTIAGLRLWQLSQ